MANNMGWCDVTLVAGAGTGAWKHPDSVAMGVGSAPTIILDEAPQKIDWVRSTAGAAPGNLTITGTAVGCTIASDNVGDTGVVRVWGWVRVPPFLYG